MTAFKALPNRLRRVPDGETGSRQNFIGWQYGVLPKELIQAKWGGGPLPEKGTVKYTIDDFEPTGYDDQAIASYTIFHEQRKAGVIPSGVRFQVSLPTPFNVVRGFLETKYCLDVESLYEERLLQAIRKIQDSIPAADLTIQLDLATEVAALEADHGRIEDPYMQPYFTPVKEGILERVGHLVKAVGSDVELGFHLCYGDMGHVHFVQPQDTHVLVDFANSLLATFGPIHPVGYIHMPVPKDRVDAAYYEPLKRLDIGDTQLFLGLVHPNDENGTKNRIKAAQASRSGSFGVSTECGMGRTPAEELNSILSIAASVTNVKK